MRILVFYGFSGSLPPSPAFPDGQDRDRSFQLVSETLGESLQHVFRTAAVDVRQAWTKDKIVTAIETAESLVDQVHVVAHGDRTGVSLAYHYDRGSRLAERIVKFEQMPGSDSDKAVAALRDEDALLSGYFTRGIEATRLAAIKSNLAATASWQIWGCWSGFETARFGQIVAGLGDDPTTVARLNAYFRRFSFGQATVSSVAVDIAKGLGVTCTAARDGWGLSVWHGTSKRTVERNGIRTPPKRPFWLWNVPGSQFVSYGSDGKRLPKPLIFGKERTPQELRGGPPPEWLIDLYWSE